MFAFDGVIDQWPQRNDFFYLSKCSMKGGKGLPLGGGGALGTSGEWVALLHLSKHSGRIYRPRFAKTTPKRSFSLIENERVVLLFAKTGSINSGTGHTSVSDV